MENTPDIYKLIYKYYNYPLYSSHNSFSYSVPLGCIEYINYISKIKINKEDENYKRISNLEEDEENIKMITKIIDEYNEYYTDLLHSRLMMINSLSIEYFKDIYSKFMYYDVIRTNIKNKRYTITDIIYIIYNLNDLYKSKYKTDIDEMINNKKIEYEKLKNIIDDIITIY